MAVDGLIIPGGETHDVRRAFSVSTASPMPDPAAWRVLAAGIPVWGTCAGAHR